jgi:dTDP-4-dehydrorhamnose reductase
MNILVTGANGQLGHEMQICAQKSNHKFVFTDVAEGYEKLDITNLDAIREKVRENDIQVIVNCAAYTNVDKAETDYDLANLLNNTAAGNLAQAMKEVDGTLIHVSTDYVFQGDKNIPCREDWETNPLGVYGKTKLAGEKSIEATGCKHIIIRTAWLYSQWGKNFVKTMQSLTASHDTLKVVFDQVGTPTYAGDLAAVISRRITKVEVSPNVLGKNRSLTQSLIGIKTKCSRTESIIISHKSRSEHLIDIQIDTTMWICKIISVIIYQRNTSSNIPSMLIHALQ